MESDVCLMLLADCVTPCEREQPDKHLFFFGCVDVNARRGCSSTLTRTHREYSLSVFTGCCSDIRREKLPAIVLQAGAIVAAFSETLLGLCIPGQGKNICRMSEVVSDGTPPPHSKWAGRALYHCKLRVSGLSRACLANYS